MIEKVTEEALVRKIRDAGETCAVFAYTPLCGTCKLARRMLEIAADAIPGLAVYECNVNFAPALVRAWSVTTVPSVLLFYKGELTGRLNRIQSVDNLFHFLRREKRHKQDKSDDK